MTSLTLLASLLQDYKAALPSATASATSSTTDITSSTGTAATSDSPAYLLDLSQAAQDILDSQNSSSSGTINLTDAQKQKLQTILDKYKDAPANSDTFNALNADLQQAGLTPDELAIVQEAKAYNPLEFLLKLFDPNASSGNSGADSILSGLSSPSSNNPIGDLLKQYVANTQQIPTAATTSDTTA